MLFLFDPDGESNHAVKFDLRGLLETPNYNRLLMKKTQFILFLFFLSDVVQRKTLVRVNQFKLSARCITATLGGIAVSERAH